MKTNTQVCLFLAVLLHLSAVNAQLLRYQFNEGIGTTAASSGSVTGSLTLRDASGTPTPTIWGASGSGPSSAWGDRALDLTSAAGMGVFGSSGPNAFGSAIGATPALTEFTITGWFRPTVSDLSRATLLEIRNGNYHLAVTGLSGGPVGARSRLRLTIETTGDSFPEVDVFGDFESQWSTPDTWAFFAITYDGQNAADRVKFYSGNIPGLVSVSATGSGASVLFPLEGDSISIGAGASNTSPFQGYLDDFRLYDEAITFTAVEQVRLQAVPEPSVLVLVGIAVMTAFIRTRFRTELSRVRRVPQNEMSRIFIRPIHGLGGCTKVQGKLIQAT